MFAMPGGVMGLLHRLGRPGRRLPRQRPRA